jgi:hypothetical protein
MDEESFYRAVSDMRRIQKTYFKTRDPYFLNRAKEAEAKVDRIIKEREELQAEKKQLQLFSR